MKDCFIPIRRARREEDTITNIDEDVQELEPLVIAVLCNEWCSHFERV